MWPLVVICEMSFHLQITVTIVIGPTGLLDVDLVEDIEHQCRKCRNEPNFDPPVWLVSSFVVF